MHLIGIFANRSKFETMKHKLENKMNLKNMQLLNINMKNIENMKNISFETIVITNEINITNTETEKILSKIKNNSYVIALAIDGKNLSSEELADTISKLAVRGNSHITFVIGGSLGLSDEVLKRADYKLSFSKMTFPHQLMRLILLEQVYRAFRINNNEPYHK